MVHSDCGGYGGLAAGFGGDTQREAHHHEAELRKAAENIWKVIPDIEIAAYFADFEGVWAVDINREPFAEPVASGAGS